VSDGTVYYALALLHEVADVNPEQQLMGNLALVGCHGRRDGVTVTDADAEALGPDLADLARSLLAWRGMPPLAEAALRLAAEHPDIANLPSRPARTIARRYLPDHAQ
jgi:hypothetical protein